MSVPNDNELKQLEQEMHDSLSRLVVRPVASEDTVRLLRALQPAFDELKPSLSSDTAGMTDISNDYPARRPSLSKLVANQLSSYSRSYWLASTGLFVMLLFILPKGEEYSYLNVLNIGSTLAMFMPMIFLAGLLYSFRSWNKEMRMIESITPYPPALLLMCRIMITSGLNILFGAFVSLYLLTRLDRFPLLPFMLQWLSLISLISGVAAFVMMRIGIKSAFAVGALFWMGWNVLDYMMRSPQPGLEWLLDLRTAIYVGSLVFGITLAVLAYRRSLLMKAIV
ncbi:hypothetical protein [Paenibacillus beijingensis]|uniref:Uncharacterized protein n=1 Tax=Paenibacillus beijingensis TaxID=1126833 RepID=A0A0D5NEX2_9BACL|nr:hypothetical protein [Paenibacillus beijingensis]AJY73680.1 hypothetical protein VN24_02330 [Paenibacillus beijingensis]